MDFMETVRKRRSVRKFKDRPVPDDVIDDILESARLAPSGGNGQGWLFGVITDKAEIRQLAKVAGNQEWIADAPLVIALCAEVSFNLQELPEDDFTLEVNRERFTPEFIDYLREYPDQRPVARLFMNPAPMIPGEHMFLTAVHHGLGACWVGYLDTQKASEILGLPDDYTCFFLMPVGYPDEAPEDIYRKSTGEISFRNRYGG
ncbi:MAG: nitroreductase family protein [Dehalococcoidales bacterium]|nr:nitroreductase family protein [Dehalococcoidales bacterium]